MGARWEAYPSDSEFKNSLSQTVMQLREAGARVWIVKQAPRQRGDVPRAAATEVRAGRDPELLGIPLAEHVERRKGTEALFEVARAAGADVLDPADYLVDARGICMAVVDGRSLYADYHHLSTYGAMRVRPLFEQVLNVHP